MDPSDVSASLFNPIFRTVRTPMNTTMPSDTTPISGPLEQINDDIGTSVACKHDIARRITEVHRVRAT